MNIRDEFSQRTKLTLALRVGFKCSDPDCGMPTSGPAHDNNKFVNVGVAAHIRAASKGGPRYDYEMTSEERKGIYNGIWLCQTHADLIDKDPIRYPKELLHRWKSASEEKARKGLTDWKPANSVEIIEEDKKLCKCLFIRLMTKTQLAC